MSDKPYTILIVEDDPAIARLTQAQLLRWGFDTVCAEDFSRVMEAFLRVQPHLVILDVSLPRYNGFYWCGEIRKVSQTPILFLTSHTEDSDVIMAMNMGADEYVTKPFSMDVLIAKINAMLRRAYEYEGERQALYARGLALSAADGTATYQSRAIDLTRNESRILRLLLERKGTIVSRETLMRALWEDEHFIDENTLTVNINRLRKKLAAEGLTDFIMTKKGEGYLVHG